MILSFWRYCHLTLAISSAIFILLASLTGIILAVEPISNQLEVGLDARASKQISIAQTLSALNQQYDEVLNIAVDENHLVTASVIDTNGNFNAYYINPLTGEKVAKIVEVAPIYQLATNLHRSLFLKSIGRFFVGLASLLMFFIALSGIALILKRQQGVKHFFSKIIRDNFYQYYHVYLGRLSLLPIIIITLTGVYLSLLRFEIIPSLTLSHKIDYEAIRNKPHIKTEAFPIFKETPLSQIHSLEFPFSEDVEDYYQLNLKDREILINQYTGDILSERTYPWVEVASRWSLHLHTGRGSIAWSIILGLACISILFFMYSGFAMTFKRRSKRIKNTYKKDECKYVILVGSESGSTIAFANILYQQLIAAGEKVYMAELNRYTNFESMEYLVVFAATYGAGEAPSNAKNFEKKFIKTTSKKTYKYAVVGFGSLAYPSFCKYAYDIEKLLQKDKNAIALQKLYTINNRSWEAFNQWVSLWSKHIGIDIKVPHENPITHKKKKKYTFEVLTKTKAENSPDDTFTLVLKNPKKKIQSGDLLAIYPSNKTHERLYSIGLNNNKDIVLSIKKHRLGLCSNYLNDLSTGDKIQASHVKNRHFHFPKKASKVLMISTGTGIAPLLGMLYHNRKKTETQLFWGGRNEASLALYRNAIKENLETKHLNAFYPAYSRIESQKTYVQNLIENKAPEVAATLKNKGVIMICGSISMQKGVTDVLKNICLEYNQKPLSYYQNKGQLLMDCY